jgi:hypothetical protein
MSLESEQEGQEWNGKVEELLYPHTLPDDASGYEMMRVIENQNEHTENSCGIHVAISDSFDYAYSWGTYLADVARAIAEQHRDTLECRPCRRGNLVTDVAADIRDGFIDAFNSHTKKEWSAETLVMAYYDEKLWPVMAEALEKAVGRPPQETMTTFKADGSMPEPREEGWWCGGDEAEVARVTAAIKSLDLEVRIFEFNENCECRERELTPAPQNEETTAHN